MYLRVITIRAMDLGFRMLIRSDFHSDFQMRLDSDLVIRSDFQMRLDSDLVIRSGFLTAIHLGSHLVIRINSPKVIQKPKDSDSEIRLNSRSAIRSVIRSKILMAIQMLMDLNSDFLTAILKEIR
jgi:hypothetical protein